VEILALCEHHETWFHPNTVTAVSWAADIKRIMVIKTPGLSSPDFSL